jgi:hypothetical protein
MQELQKRAENLLEQVTLAVERLKLDEQTAELGKLRGQMA